MTIVDWIFIGIAAVLAVASVIMVGMAVNLMYKMCAAGPDKAEKMESEEEIPEIEALDSKGPRIGTYYAGGEDSRLRQSVKLALYQIAMHCWKRNIEIAKSYRSGGWVYYELTDGTKIDILPANGMERGRRYNYLYIDKAISDNLIMQVLLPQITPFCGELKIIDDWQNDNWEFFNANTPKQDKKEWENGEWN